MKKLLTCLFILLPILSFSKESYLLDENRIKNVFSQWEFLQIENRDILYIDILNRETDTRIQISTYANEDTINKARDRFHKSTTNSGFELLSRNENVLSNKYFGVESRSYIKKYIHGEKRKEHIFLNKVKFSIEYVEKLENYENLLKMIKEAIDPSIPLQSRSQRVFNKNYSIDNYIDKNRLIANSRSTFGNVTFYEVEGTSQDVSEYEVMFDENKLATRVILVQSNNNYSERVILNRFENRLLAVSNYPYKFRDEEKRITQKYFGVNARTYVNDYVRRESKLPILGVMRIAITKDFTIITMTYEARNNKRQELVEYEAFLKIVQDSMK